MPHRQLSMFSFILPFHENESKLNSAFSNNHMARPHESIFKCIFVFPVSCERWWDKISSTNFIYEQNALTRQEETRLWFDIVCLFGRRQRSLLMKIEFDISKSSRKWILLLFSTIVDALEQFKDLCSSTFSYFLVSAFSNDDMQSNKRKIHKIKWHFAILRPTFIWIGTFVLPCVCVCAWIASKTT